MEEVGTALSLPYIFFTIGIENRFFQNAVLAECQADIVLVIRCEVTLFPVEAVVFPAAEVGEQLALQGVKVFVRNFIQQVPDAPCDPYLLGGLEEGALAAVGRDAQRIDDADGWKLGRVVQGGKAAQAVVGFCALGVEATCVAVGCQRLFGRMFHGCFLN